MQTKRRMSQEDDRDGLFQQTNLNQSNSILNAQPSAFLESSRVKLTSVCKTAIYVFITLLILMWVSAKVSSLSNQQAQGSRLADEYETQTPFTFPKKLWVFHSNKENQSNHFQLIKQNHIQYARKTQATYDVLNFTNYKQFLSHQRFTSVQQTISECFSQSNNETQDNGLHILCQQLVLFSVLLENGGVAISQDYAFTTGLEWLEQIGSNPSVVKGSQLKKTEVVGFFDPKSSSELLKIQTSSSIHAPFRYSREVVAIYPMFLAATQNTQFLHDLCSEITDLIQTPSKISNLSGEVDRGYLEREFYVLAITHRMMARRQQYLNKTQSETKLASDSYGLSLINFYEGPEKLIKRTGQARPLTYTLFDYLIDYSAQDVQDLLGPSPYGLRIFQFDQLTKVKQGRKKVMKGSFMHQMFPTIVKDNTYSNIEVSTQNAAAPLWDNLPRKLWVFWGHQFDKSSIVNRLALRIMKSKLKGTGFQITLVTLDNYQKFIDQDRLRQILTLSFAYKLQITTVSDLIRLALLEKHGGVYMDISTFLQDDLSWVFKIARYPSKYFFNRFESLPKVLMQYYPHEGWSGQWYFDQKSNTKSQSMLGLQNSFIAAEPGSELISDWLDVFFEFIPVIRKPAKLQIAFKQCGIHRYRWVNDYNKPYLLAMDSLKCVMARKEKILSSRYRNACHYYRTWAFNGFYGPQKFRHYVEIENIWQAYSPLMVQYSREYADFIVGKSYFPFVKLFRRERDELSDWLKNTSDDFKVRMHPKSLLRRIMNEASIDIMKNQRTNELIIVDKN